MTIKVSQRYLAKKNKINLNFKNKNSPKFFIENKEEVVVNNTKPNIDSQEIVELKINYLVNNPTLSSREGKMTGETTFDVIKSLFKMKKVRNEANRDEEIDTVKSYLIKVGHMIRYIVGVSEKSPVLASVYRDTPDKSAWVRDNGTMISLMAGEYFDDKKLKGSQWLELLDNIEEEYKIDEGGSEDDIFINLIRKYFENLSEQQLDLKYSLKQVVVSSDIIENMYYNTRIQYCFNLLTKHQSGKDMINANLQPNAWIAYNYYISGLKETPQYQKIFIGNELKAYFQNKVGSADFPSKKGQMMARYQGKAQEKRVNKLIPIYVAYCVSHYSDDLEKAYLMIVDFQKFENKEVLEYWVGMFTKMVINTTYQDMIDWYNNTYKPIFEDTNWEHTKNKIVDILNNNGMYTSPPASMTDFRVSKFDTGLWFMSIATWFKENNKKVGKSKIVRYITESYVKMLDGEVQYEDPYDRKIYNVPVYKYFGTKRDRYSSTSAKQRLKHILKYVVKDVEKRIKSNKDDRSDEAKLLKMSKLKHLSSITGIGVPPFMKLYPLSTDVMDTINFFNGNGLQWLHKKPQLLGGLAKDGFLGMVDDNLTGNVKFKDWNQITNQMVYWKLLAEHNSRIAATIEDSFVKNSLENSISILEQMIDMDLTVQLNNSTIK